MLRSGLLFPSLFNVAAACLMMLLVLSRPAAAMQEWSQFLGPGSEATAPADSRPPVTWTEDDYAWVAEVPGTGWSSPVYANGRVWLTTAILAEADSGGESSRRSSQPESVDLRALCYDLETGALLVNRSLKVIENPPAINPLNSFASPTPVIVDGRVICHFGSFGTWCLDASSGRTLWETAYVVKHSVGPGSSPVVDGNRVLLVCDGTDQQYVVAVDLQTGSELWKTERPSMRATDGENRKAYCTPLITELAGRRQAIIPTAQWVISYDPETGEEIWRADHGDGFSVTPVPTEEGGLVVFSTGFMRPEFVAIDPSGEGDVTQTHIRWRARNAPTMASMVSADGRMYGVSDKGLMSCVEMESGEVLNLQRLGGNYSASPLLANGLLYFSSREGTVTVVRCGPELEVVATQEFPEGLMASPAVVGNDLLFRTKSRLIRVAGPSPQ